MILDDDVPLLNPSQEDNNIIQHINEDESLLLNTNEDDTSFLNIEEQPLQQIQSENDADDLLYYDGDVVNNPTNTTNSSGLTNETPDYDLDYIDDLPPAKKTEPIEITDIVSEENMVPQIQNIDNNPQPTAQDNNDDLLVLDDEEEKENEDFIRPASMQNNDFVRPAGINVEEENDDDLLILDEDEEIQEPVRNTNKSLEDDNNDLLILDEEEEVPKQEAKAPSQLDMILQTINNSKQEEKPKEKKAVIQEKQEVISEAKQETQYDEDGFEIINDSTVSTDETPSTIENEGSTTIDENVSIQNDEEEPEIVQEPFPDTPEPSDTPEPPEPKKHVYREFKDAITAKAESQEARKLNNIAESVPAEEPLVNSTGSDDEDEYEDEEDVDTEKTSLKDKNQNEDDEYDEDSDDEDEYEDEDEASSNKKGLIIKISIGVALLVVLIGAAFAAKTFIFKDKNSQTEQALQEGADVAAPTAESEPAGGIVVPDDNNTKQTETNPPQVDEGGISIPASGDNAQLGTNMPPQEAATPPAQTPPPKAGTSNATTGDMNKAVANAFSSNPSALSIHKVSWGVSSSLAGDASFKTYLQKAGKTAQSTIQNKLGSVKGAKPTSPIKVQIKMTETGALQDVIILQSSGATEIDTVVLQSVKQAISSLPLPTLSASTLQANEQATGAKTIKMSLTVTF